MDWRSVARISAALSAFVLFAMAVPALPTFWRVAKDVVLRAHPSANRSAPQEFSFSERDACSAENVGLHATATFSRTPDLQVTVLAPFICGVTPIPSVEFQPTRVVLRADDRLPRDTNGVAYVLMCDCGKELIYALHRPVHPGARIDFEHEGTVTKLGLAP